jgi:hypothetical protein
MTEFTLTMSIRTTIRKGGMCCCHRIKLVKKGLELRGNEFRVKARIRDQVVKGLGFWTRGKAKGYGYGKGIRLILLVRG